MKTVRRPASTAARFVWRGLLGQIGGSRWRRSVVMQYADIPPVVREAILATEDKRFFSHNGVDYLSIPRVVGKVRVGA